MLYKWELPLERISKHALAVFRVGTWDRAKGWGPRQSSGSRATRAESWPGGSCAAPRSAGTWFACFLLHCPLHVLGTQVQTFWMYELMSSLQRPSLLPLDPQIFKSLPLVNSPANKCQSQGPEATPLFTRSGNLDTERGGNLPSELGHTGHHR